MNHSYTPEDLLEYLYKETDPVRTQAIEVALQSDWTYARNWLYSKQRANVSTASSNRPAPRSS